MTRGSDRYPTGSLREKIAAFLFRDTMIAAWRAGFSAGLAQAEVGHAIREAHIDVYRRPPHDLPDTDTTGYKALVVALVILLNEARGMRLGSKYVASVPGYLILDAPEWEVTLEASHESDSTKIAIVRR